MQQVSLPGRCFPMPLQATALLPFQSNFTLKFFRRSRECANAKADVITFSMQGKQAALSFYGHGPGFPVQESSHVPGSLLSPAFGSEQLHHKSDERLSTQ
jgi:hypothetical protein